MTEEVLEQTLGTYLRLPFAAKSIALQGGEPLLAPRWLLEHIARLASSAELSLQTNATLITEDIAEFLARERWLVGASLDGDAELNDAMRGEGSYEAAVRGIRLLEKHNVDYNLLTVVSRANVAHPERVYTHLRDNFSTRFHQYIECTGPHPAYAISGDEWGEFLCRLFDKWAEEDLGEISIRLFESTASILLRGFPSLCSQSPTCRHYFVVDWDGSVYPCDFFVCKELRLGNVMTHSWQEMLDSPVYARFAATKSETLGKECRACEYLGLCAGDCPRNRKSLCAGYKRFFKHALASGIINMV